jgi:uncharacterized membrane protein
MKALSARIVLCLVLFPVSFISFACTTEKAVQTEVTAADGSATQASSNKGKTNVSGCWQSNYGSDTASITDKYMFEPGGNYSGSRTIIGVNTGDIVTTYSGKWTVDNEYVLIQDITRDATITLKVISEYELRSGSDNAYSRC